METPNELIINEKPKREQSMIYAVILNLDDSNSYSCVIEAKNMKQVQEMVDALDFNYSIVGLFKGKALHFTETKQIKLV